MNQPKARENNIVVQELENETLVYDLDINKAFCLNETSKIVWQLCDGKHTVSQISDEMSKRMKSLVSEDLVRFAINQLSKDGLLKNANTVENNFGGLSRREVVRRIGFASAIALPVVSSLVAPQAYMAQSMAAANGQACTPINNASCASNNCLNAGGVTGICCDAGSTQANAPSYNVCTTDATAADFDFRCCSGKASPSGGAPCPIGQTRYICDPY